MALNTSLGMNIYSTWNGSGIAKARKDLVGLGNQSENVTSKVSLTSRALNGVGTAMRETASSMGVAAGAAAGAVATWGAASVAAGLKSNALVQNVRVGLTSVLGSAEAAEKQLGKLDKFVSESPFQRTIWLQAQQQLLGFGVEADKAIPLLDAIQNTTLAGGGTEANIVRITEVLARMRSSGQLTISDFNELGTEGVNAAKIIASELGTTESAVRDMVSSGELSVDQFYDAFISGSEKAFGNMSEGVKNTTTGMLDRLKGVQRRIGELFATPFINPTGGGLLVTLGNAIADVLNKVEDAIRPLVPLMTERLTPGFERIGNAVATAGAQVTTSGVQSFFGELARYAPLIGGAIAGIGAAFAGSLPVLGPYVAGLNPIVAGIGVLIALSPPLREAFGRLLSALAPLVPPMMTLGRVILDIVIQALSGLARFIAGPVTSAITFLVPYIVDLVTWVGTWLPGAFNVASAIIGGIVTVLSNIITWIANTKAAIVTLGIILAPIALAMIGHWIRMGVVATISAARQVIAWVVMRAQMVISAGVFVTTQLVMIAGWIKMAVIATANAVRMAAAWIIAMGPIGWIIAAVIALVAVIILNWDRIKAITVIIWTAVKDWIINAWNSIVDFLRPAINFVVNMFKAAWDGLKLAIQIVVTIILAIVAGFVFTFKTIWQGIVIVAQAVWNALKAGANWFNANVIQPIIGFVRMLVDWIKARLNVLYIGWLLVWNKLKAAATWFFVNVVTPIRNAIMAMVNYIKGRLEILRAGWLLIWNKIKALWTWFNNTVIEPIKTRIRIMVDYIKGRWELMRAAGVSVFDKLKNKIEWFRDKFDAVKNKIGQFVDSIKSKWNGMRDSAESVFKRIQGYVRTPMKWVIDKVYNGGIRKFWNKVSDKLFGGDNHLPEVSTKGWARGGAGNGGGPVRGAGTWKSDSVASRLAKGEHVWTSREVAAAGGHGKVMQMRSAVLRGRPVSAGPDGKFMRFKGGGFWETLGDAAGIAKNSAEDLFGNLKEGDFYGALADSFEALSPLLDKIPNLMDGFTGKFNLDKIKPFHDMMHAGVKKVRDKLLEYISGLLSMGGGMGGGPGDYKAMSAWIKEAVPGTIITSGLRNGTGTSYHNVGKAIDMAFTDGSERTGGGIAKKAYNTIKSTWLHSILELIWDFSPDGNSVGIKNGKSHKYTGASAGWGSHADHIHWANEGSGGEAMGWGSYKPGEIPQGGAISRWKGIVSRVLSDMGIYSTAAVNSVLECIRQESSGRPDLQNNWDINAKNGVPSKGLMQVIPPTYESYKPRGRSGNIWTPYNNIYAAVNYARDRYGKRWMAAITAPGGYSLGGEVKPLSFDEGGLLPRGISVVHNGTGKPEPVGHDLVGNGDTINIYIEGSVLTTDRQLEDIVVKAVTSAKKKGRKL